MSNSHCLCLIVLRVLCWGGVTAQVCACMVCTVSMQEGLSGGQGTCQGPWWRCVVMSTGEQGRWDGAAWVCAHEDGCSPAAMWCSCWPAIGSKEGVLKAVHVMMCHGGQRVHSCRHQMRQVCCCARPSLFISWPACASGTCAPFGLLKTL